MKWILARHYLQPSLLHFRSMALVGLGVVSPVLCAAASPDSPLDCVLEPYEVVEVSSAVQGVINQIHVSRNDMVGKGQLLVELDSEVQKTQVELARARATLETDIELRETELAFHERNEQRLDKLYESDTVSLHIKDEAETDTQKSRLQLRSALENKRLAELELAEAEAMLALRSMRSPISGVVVARNKVAGEYVEDQSILRLAQLDPLKVEVIAPVELFGSIKAGMLVEVVPEYLGQAPVFATVTMVDRVIDPASGTFDVRAELPNPDLTIPSGLRCTVRFLKEPYSAAAIAAVSTAAVSTAAVSTAAVSTEAETSAPAEPASAPDEELESAPVPEQMAEQTGAQIAERKADEQTIAKRDLTVRGAPEPDPFTAISAPINSHVAMESDLALCAVARTLDVTRYSVFVESSINSISAAEILVQLRNEGVQDLYEQPRSGNHGKIFLGVYSRLANAEKRQAEISNLGLLVSLESSAQQAPTETECHTEEQIAARGL